MLSNIGKDGNKVIAYSLPPPPPPVLQLGSEVHPLQWFTKGKTKSPSEPPLS